MFVLIYENVVCKSAAGLDLCSADRLLQDMTSDTHQKKVNLQASTHMRSETRKANVRDGVLCIVMAATTVLSGPMCLVLAEQQ